MPRYPEQTWHLQPAAQRALASIEDNHPTKVRTPAPLHTIFAGGPEHVLDWNPNDERVDALRMMADEAFRTLEARTDSHTAYALVPSSRDVIAAAVARRKVAA